MPPGLETSLLGNFRYPFQNILLDAFLDRAAGVAYSNDRYVIAGAAAGVVSVPRFQSVHVTFFYQDLKRAVNGGRCDRRDRAAKIVHDLICGLHIRCMPENFQDFLLHELPTFHCWNSH